MVLRSLGARVELMSPAMMRRRWPWLNVDDIALGSFGIENEGCFDPWALITMLKTKAMELGVTYVHGDLYNFYHEGARRPRRRRIIFNCQFPVHILIYFSVDPYKVYTDDQELLAENDRLDRPIREAHAYLHDGDVWPMHAAHFIIAAGPQSG